MYTPEKKLFKFFFSSHKRKIKNLILNKKEIKIIKKNIKSNLHREEIY